MDTRDGFNDKRVNCGHSDSHVCDAHVTTIEVRPTFRGRPSGYIASGDIQ